MQKFQDVYIKYLNIDIGELTSNQKDYLYNFLKHILPEDLCDIKEHKMYIELLQKLRMANVKDMEIVGEKFLTTISSLLAVGEDGVYSNGQRFIYELIQNVDDCEYSNVDDCHLDILFNYSVDPGEIIFTYNEKGFKPENVFAITGIAEKSKNISMEKIEIGEKGIGFKSVFGIAESVHIESGMFSFELFKNNFTVPVPRYENFKPVNGTRMKLKVSAESVKNIYRNMVNEYKTKQSVLNKNPILFLNKLTDLKIYFDSNRYIKFKVERKSPKVVDELLFEENVGISIDAKDYLNGMDYGYNRKIECIRYTKTILYNKEECWSRYGTDALFLKKSHKLIALFPKQDNKTEKFNGTLYSFLPTQIQMTIPMVLHVPFKLDGAREFVDSQKRNKWFKFTIEQLRKFLIEVYRHFSTVIKQDIIDYLPAIDEFFFKNTNEKVSCLLINDLKGRIVCSEKIFYTADGQYVDYKNAISFDRNETISNPKQVFKFLKCTNKLFIPNKNVNMRIFDVQIISNVAEKLLERGLKAEDDFEEIACILDEMDNDYEKVIEKNCPLKLTESQLKTVGNHQQIYKAISSYVLKCINKNEIPQIYIQAVLSEMPKQFSDDIQEYIKTAGIQSKFVSYLRKINYQFYALKEINRNLAILCNSGMILSAKNPRESFAIGVSIYDQTKIFAAMMQIQAQINKLDEVSDNMSEIGYLKLLQKVRGSIRNIIGTEKYNNYVKIINQSGQDKNRFLSEIIQNADDCFYEDDVIPEFVLSISDKKLEVFYNERGFTKENVRAITEIGESTKRLLDSTDDLIGEKGVGFKTVFAVADIVEIHSNKFEFRLEGKKPTVPFPCPTIYKNGVTNGTTLIFHLKENVTNIIKKKDILELCLCLRKLKKIIIDNIVVSIKDTVIERIITIDDKEYCFEKYCYKFKVSNLDIHEEMGNSKKNTNIEQKIMFYIPENKIAKQYSFYVGLPLKFKTNIPIVIDAPFELTTSRENVIKSNWNDIVKSELYKALIRFMYDIRETKRIDIFQYIKIREIDGKEIFSEKYLNLSWSNIISKLKKEELLPVIGENKFVSTGNVEACFIVPDVVAYIFKQKYIKNNFREYYSGEIVDAYKKSQYIKLLKKMGCKNSDIDSDIRCIQTVIPDLMDDVEFREMLYKYITDIVSKNKNDFKEKILKKIIQMPIVPVRFEAGVKYVVYNTNIYIHDERMSDDQFQILDTDILESHELEKMFGYRVHINELTEEVYDYLYQKKISSYIESAKNDEEKAKYLLSEFIDNRDQLEMCKSMLMGMLDKVPLKMLSGEYKKGNKFINGSEEIKFVGIIKRMVVDDEYRELAEFLECKNIFDISYEDFDINIETLVDNDIQDLRNGFQNYLQILQGFFEDEKITDELIEKYGLEYLISDEEYDEEFPENAVYNLKEIQKRIEKEFKENPNPYENKIRIIREPMRKVDKRYMQMMYISKHNHRKCFCQMCKKIFPENYIERNDVRKLPQYAWNQMYLNLCLNCSKDYQLLRNDDCIWKKFVYDINKTSITDQKTIEITIGRKSITFTAMHLAEIQIILKIEANIE